MRPIVLSRASVETARAKSSQAAYENKSNRPRQRAALTFAAVPLVIIAMVLPFATNGGQSLMAPVAPDLLDPLMIPKWVNQLTGPPPVWEPTVVTDEDGDAESHDYTVEMRAFTQQILPAPYPTTPVWGYAGYAMDSVTGAPLGYIMNSPGASFEATRGIPINVKWINEIDDEHMFAVDPTLHWADPNMIHHEVVMDGPPFEPYPPGYPEAQYPVPLVTHLHGGEVQSTSDGGPDAWFTVDGKHGSGFYPEVEADEANAALYHYPNEQPATTLWYHDHALGITRINVMSGLAGFYLLRDSDAETDPVSPLLPSGKYDMPLVIQDRTFNADGSFFFDTVGLNVDVHPYWMPEFFGNAIMVNGLAWPNMDVDQGVYRFRLLDGSNARFYTLSFSNGMPFTVIATDGGFLRTPVAVTKLTIAPGERYEILVDFSDLAPGTKVVMLNSAKTPFPTGKPPQGATTGQIVQFTVGGNPGPSMPDLPLYLNPYIGMTYPSIEDPVAKTRTLVLVEVMGANGPLEILLNGQKWDAPVSETPVLGTTEEWVIVNPTADTHPIHLHLAQFQVVSRQRIDTTAYYDDWVALNGGMMPPFMTTPSELPIAPYLKGKAKAAPLFEQGWKDTVQMNPGEVTVIKVRFAPIDGSEEYPFDATYGPGYVWHCHILDHEDNEMMRPYIVTRPDD
ncbi:MAG TPA: multicopper oxidase [Thermoplasmata archaeon]